MNKSFNPKPPKVLDDNQIEQLEALASFLTIPQIADYFMISSRTFHRIMERQPEAMARYKKGKANAILNVANSLMAQIRNGDVASTIFFLKTQAGWSEKSNEQEDTRPMPSKVIIKGYDGRKSSNTGDTGTEG